MNFFILLLISLSVHYSFAQEALTLKKNVELSKKKEKQWQPKLKLSTNYSLNSSKDVIGQVDGDTVTLGGKIETALNYYNDLNEWRNNLDYQGATTKTPAIPRYVKSADNLKYKTIFLKGLESYPNIGPYVSVDAEAPIFKGEDVQSTSKTYTTPTGTFTASSTQLTDAFAPITTKEAFGLFYKAINREMTKLEFRLGLGAIQVHAKNQLQVTETTDTTVTVAELESYNQAGFEYGFLFKGKWNDQSDYSLTADFLTPINRSSDGAIATCMDCSNLELTNIEVAASLSTKASQWATFSYEYKAIKKPQLLNKFQIQHGFAFNIAYDFFGK